MSRSATNPREFFDISRPAKTPRPFLIRGLGIYVRCMSPAHVSMVTVTHSATTHPQRICTVLASESGTWLPQDTRDHSSTHPPTYTCRPCCVQGKATSWRLYGSPHNATPPARNRERTCNPRRVCSSTGRIACMGVVCLSTRQLTRHSALTHVRLDNG